MSKPKVIKRYFTGRITPSIAAGVYSASGSILITSQYNLIVTDYMISVRAEDTVSGQGIDVSCLFRSIGVLDTGKVDSPGFKSSNDEGPSLAMSNGGGYNLNVHRFMSSEQNLHMQFEFALHSVTANIVLATACVAVGYLSPEDYLSVDAGAALVGY